MWRLAIWLVRGAIVAIAAFAGWIVGNGLGYAAGIALDIGTGNDWVSWALVTIPLAGLICISLGVWLGWRLARRVTTARQASLAGSGVLVTLVFGMFVLVPVAKGMCAFPTSSDRFDAAVWQADDGDWPCTEREAMLPDVLDMVEPGWSETRVRELLGPPATDPAIAWPDPDALIWKVRCGIDCEWLVVSAEDGLVTDIELAED